MQFFFQYKAINYTNKPLSLDALKFITIMIDLFQIVFGNIMPKLRRNSFIGLRTSWSIAND
ncbi:MAG: SdpI family protein [Peptostreptococcaceae bacterium]|jgi:integral membrane protein|nr:SdpI family protein [Peptostreptococcaceae bacterium]